MDRPVATPSTKLTQRTKTSELDKVTPPGAREGPRAGFSCVLYGPSGSGKTTAVGTLKNPLVLYTERNLMALERINKPHIIVRSWEQLLRIQGEIGQAVATGAFPYDAVALDSISAVEIIMAEAIWGRGKLWKGGDEWMSVKQRGVGLLERFAEWADPSFSKTPIDVVIAARVTYSKDEGTGRLHSAPLVPGRALEPILFAMVDFVFYCYVEEVLDKKTARTEPRFRWQTRTLPPHNAKDGSDKLAVFEEPTFVHVREVLGR